MNKKKNPLVSVIIPVYNVEKYLDKCVQSVVDQTYKDLEIILVDDGSPDNSPQLCDDWAEKDDRIVVIHKKNGGLSDARNHGLDVSTGEYIAFVDSDDYIERNMIETLVYLVLKDYSDLSMCSYKLVDEEGKEINAKNCVVSETVQKKEFYKRLTEPGWGYYVIACAKLYKKSLFNNIKFPVGKINEDSFIMHWIIYECEKISVVDDKLYNYVQRADSIMHKGYTIKNLDDFEAFYDRFLFLKNNGYKEFLADIVDSVVNRYFEIFIGLKMTSPDDLIKYNNVIKIIREMTDWNKKHSIKCFGVFYFPRLFYKCVFVFSMIKNKTFSFKEIGNVIIPRRIQIRKARNSNE